MRENGARSLFVTCSTSPVATKRSWTWMPTAMTCLCPHSAQGCGVSGAASAARTFAPTEMSKRRRAFMGSLDSVTGDGGFQGGVATQARDRATNLSNLAMPPAGTPCRAPSSPPICPSRQNLNDANVLGTVHPKPLGSTDCKVKARSHLIGNSARASIIDADDERTAILRNRHRQFRAYWPSASCCRIAILIKPLAARSACSNGI